MKAKVTTNFVDRIESAEQGKEVLRKVGDEFILSKERFEEIERAGDFVKEIKAKPDSKK
jgi:hypothetical protein